MEEVRSKGGRPPGRTYSRKLFSYVDDEGTWLAQELARRRKCSVAALIRALIEEEAERAGVGAPIAREVTPEQRETSRARFRELLEKAQGNAAASGLTPEELEQEVTLAAAEVARSNRRARRR